MVKSNFWYDNKILFFNSLNNFLKASNQRLDIFETNPPSAIFNAFSYWLDHVEKDYIPEKCFDVWISENAHNDSYFSPGYDNGLLYDYDYVRRYFEEFDKQIDVPILPKDLKDSFEFRDKGTSVEVFFAKGYVGEFPSPKNYEQFLMDYFIKLAEVNKGSCLDIRNRIARVNKEYKQEKGYCCIYWAHDVNYILNPNDQEAEL